MLRFLLRRLLLIPPAVVLVHFLGFSYAHFVRPLRAARNPFLAAVTEPTPILPAYQVYWENVLRGEFGILPALHLFGNRPLPLLEGMRIAAGASFGLMFLALLLSIILGLILGLSAVQVKPPGVAQWLSSISTMGLAMPSFYLGSLFFAFWFLYIIWRGPGTQAPLPFQGFGWDNHLIMPTLVLMARPTVQVAQVAATLMVEELNKQYITTARSVGASWRMIRSKHALRNVISPVIVTIAGALRLLVAELIVVEWLFSWPGLGNLLAQTLIPSQTITMSSTGDSILFLNPAVVAAVLGVFAAMFLLADVIASAMGRAFDPRLRVD
jgi:peptide/nickel transport system permease protein